MSARSEQEFCETLIAPFTVCGQPVDEDDDMCASHRNRMLWDLARQLIKDRDEARQALADQRAKYEAVADELDRDHGSALDDARIKKDAILTGIAAGYSSAAKRIRQVSA